jgi:hypothetical protein
MLFSKAIALSKTSVRLRRDPYWIFDADCWESGWLSM